MKPMRSGIGSREVRANRAQQLWLPLANAGADAERLQRTLRAYFGMPLRLVVTDNRSTMLSFSARERPPILRAHRMFLDAPDAVVEAMAEYFRRGDKGASSVLDSYIEARRDQIRTGPHRRRRTRIRHAGRYFHLGRIRDDLSARFFEAPVQPGITWGRRGKRGWRRVIRLGSYTADEDLIRIHPGLDRAFVPRFFVEFVVYHEMLHAVLDPPVVGGRRRYHDAEFRRREQRFPEYARALAWEKRNLDKLLRVRSASPNSS